MKILKWLVIIVVGGFLLLMASIFIRNKAIGPVGWAEDNTTKALKTKLKDPSSMTIRSSYVVEKTLPNGNTEIYICGIVDGKNSFGGYTGGSRFVSKSVSSKSLNTFDTYIVEVEDETVKSTAHSANRLSPFEKVYWNEYCVDDTHPKIKPKD
jgi:hypothetical protein